MNKKHILKTHGFWDYSTPGSGGLERYTMDDYHRLFDDMNQAGMNSLLLVVKWFTTGYRSTLPFMDQDSNNLVIASDNEILRNVISESKKRDIKVWLGANVNIYPKSKMKSEPWSSGNELFGIKFPFEFASYDLDSNEVEDNALEMCRELTSLFPEIAGLMIEIEFSGIEMPHRIPFYNEWAKKYGYKAFHEIGHPLNPRVPDIASWRDYTTHRRAELMKKIELSLREQGFQGELATLCETGGQPYLIAQDVNLEKLHSACPAWSAVSYEYTYDKSRNRFGMMEMAIEEPKRAGLKTYYLPRGVMTYGPDWPMPLSLRQSWQTDLEDIERFQPDGVWWFGAGYSCDGAHIQLDRLQQSGFQNGEEARKSLLKSIVDFRT